RLVEALEREGHRTIAMISGGHVLETLVADGVLDRLYLTLACRIVGGLAFDTLFSGPELAPAAGFELAALHDDAGVGGDGARRASDSEGSGGASNADAAGVEQLFAVLDRSG